MKSNMNTTIIKKAKRYRDDGGLTASNKNANIIQGSRNTGGLIKGGKTPTVLSNRIGGKVFTQMQGNASAQNTNYINIQGKTNKSSYNPHSRVPQTGVNYITPTLRKAKKSKLANALPSYRR